MKDEKNVVKGMPMFAPGDPEVLAREVSELRNLQSKGKRAKLSGIFPNQDPDGCRAP